ncbi:hypothetical protein A6D98_09755 [Aliivibrio fischeri]|nr:hypothetical protein A6E09_17160 [Aliivibrio fischeri]OCH60918.1 hypothetical protein A6D98_09755 [Aliivibrio fischeri]
MQKVFDKFSEFKGRLIAYGGGSGVSAYSAKSTAQVHTIPEATTHQTIDVLSVYIFPGVTFGSAITIIGAAVVVVRLVFDVWKYFDQRKRRLNKEAA